MGGRGKEKKGGNQSPEKEEGEGKGRQRRTILIKFHRYARLPVKREGKGKKKRKGGKGAIIALEHLCQAAQGDIRKGERRTKEEKGKSPDYSL